MLLRIDWPANNKVMGTLTLARHGQASFGAANYDQLSDRGHLQSERLGAYYATQGSPFDVVYHGSLTRHLETWAGIQRHLKATALPVHCRPGLNEFDGNAIVTAYQAAHDLPPVAASDYKAYFRLLRKGLEAWMAAEIEPAGMGTYAKFRASVLAVMAEIQADHHHKRVLVVTSGGPISTVVGSVLETPDRKTVDINYQIHNTAVTTFNVTPSGLRLSGFNATPHLDPQRDTALFTFA